MLGEANGAAMTPSLLRLSTQGDAVTNPGHDRPFMELLDEHGPVVLALLRRLCRDHHEAEDAFQETAVRVWRNMAGRPRLRNPRGWLMTIAYRVYVDQVARRRKPESGHDGSLTPDHRLPSPEALAEQGEEQIRVRKALAELPESLREVMALHYTARLSLSETAGAMGLSVGTVKSRLNTALERLRGVLQ